MTDTFHVEPSKRKYPHIGTDPVVVEELKNLAEKNNGLLKAEDVVEAARSPDNPLHDKFEWDDEKAGEKFRLIQARFMISVCVQYVPVKDKSIPTKVFVSLSTDRNKRDGTSGYRTFVDVMSDPDMKNQLLMDSLEAMTHFQEKYKSLQELEKVFTTMDAESNRLKKRLIKKAS